MSMTVVPGMAIPVYGQQNDRVVNVRSCGPVVITEATAADLEILYQMSVALAMFERKSAAEIQVTREKLWRCAFGPNKVFSALIARRDNQPIGMAVFYYAYAGSLGAPILYCEDLFVERLHRRHGVATLMLKELVMRASQFGCCRVQGTVFNWNDEAARCYEKLGAQIRRDLHQVRLDSSRFKSVLENPDVYV